MTPIFASELSGSGKDMHVTDAPAEAAVMRRFRFVVPEGQTERLMRHHHSQDLLAAEVS
jgi:hypothetical protein